jgi:hypothetical protein
MESMLAHHSMIAMRELEESGELPAPPKEHSNLIDQVRISVHPQ